MEQTHSEGAHGLKTGLGVRLCEICPEATGPSTAGGGPRHIQSLPSGSRLPHSPS